VERGVAACKECVPWRRMEVPGVEDPLAWAQARSLSSLGFWGLNGKDLRYFVPCLRPCSRPTAETSPKDRHPFPVYWYPTIGLEFPEKKS
jgi:hypothetical protein